MPVRLRIERGAGLVLETGTLRTRILRRSEAMLALLQLEKGELSLVLSGDDQIHQLNKIYRGKDRPTDVLAFSMREGDFGRLHASLPSRLLGDVIVSVPTATRQAKTAKREPLEEITMLIAHGLLHLLGWDHETPSKDRKMRAETDRLVAAAFDADAAPPRRASRAHSGARSRQKTAQRARAGARAAANKGRNKSPTSRAPNAVPSK